MPSVLQFVVYAIYAGVLLYVSWTDLRTRRIPNVVIGPAILLALLAMYWTIGVTSALLGGIIAPLPLIIARLLAGASKMGMGDIKMAIFVGLILGVDFALIGVVIGLVLSAKYDLVCNRLFLDLLATLGAIEDHPGLKIIAEVLEAVLDASRHKEHVARTERMTLAAVEELTTAGHHHI